MHSKSYILQDEQNISGQTISLIQGDTKTIKCFLFNEDGSPRFILGTITELLVKVLASINGPSIQKRYSTSQVTLIKDDTLGLFGFEFTLSSADTLSMAANNSGLPLTAEITLSTGATIGINIQSGFDVQLPVVLP